MHKFNCTDSICNFAKCRQKCTVRLGSLSLSGEINTSNYLMNFLIASSDNQCTPCSHRENYIIKNHGTASPLTWPAYRSVGKCAARSLQAEITQMLQQHSKQVAHHWSSQADLVQQLPRHEGGNDRTWSQHSKPNESLLLPLKNELALLARGRWQIYVYAGLWQLLCLHFKGAHEAMRHW